jgi:RNA recognition motif-containing protein
VTTVQELEHLFSPYGKIERITLKTGYAYLEFADKSMVDAAIANLQNSPLHGRKITV